MTEQNNAPTCKDDEKIIANPETPPVEEIAETQEVTAEITEEAKEDIPEITEETEEAPEENLPAPTAEVTAENNPPKKKGGLKIALIAVLVFTLLIGSAFVFFPDHVDYFSAGLKFNSGKYEEAIEIYKGFDKDFLETEEKLIITYEALGDKQISEKRYGDAVISYKNAGNNEKLDNAYISWGDFYMENASYYNAIDAYESVKNIDVSGKIDEGYYQYFLEKKSDYNVLHIARNHDKFKELADKNYKDAKTVYDEAYKWKVKVFLRDKLEDSITTDMDSVKRTKTMYFTVWVQGVKPGEEIKLRYKATIPGGTLSEKFTLKHDYYVTPIIKYNSPSSAPTGKATFKIYNDKTDELLFTKEFKVPK